MASPEHGPGPDKLRAWRGERTQVEAAQIIGCNPSFISQLETAKNQPSIDWAIVIEHHTGIPPRDWWLVGKQTELLHKLVMAVPYVATATSRRKPRNGRAEASP